MVVGACRQGACWCLGGDRRRLVGGPLRPILAGGWQVKKGPQAVVGGPVRMPGLERRNSVFPGFLEASTEHKKHYRTLRGDLRNGCKWALGLWTWTWADAVAAGVRQQSQDVAQAGSADRRCAAGRCRAGLPCGVGQHGHVAPVAKRQGAVARPPRGQEMSVVAGPRGAQKKRAAGRGASGASGSSTSHPRSTDLYWTSFIGRASAIALKTSIKP